MADIDTRVTEVAFLYSETSSEPFVERKFGYTVEYDTLAAHDMPCSERSLCHKLHK